jgi:hypothetical protein
MLSSAEVGIHGQLILGIDLRTADVAPTDDETG